MRAEHSLTALREALQCLMRSDLPSAHKAVIIEAVTQTLSTRESQECAADSQPPPKAWEERDIEALRVLLEGRIAKSWQEADELLTRSARQLSRHPDEVREQAALLGLGVAVDYRQARAAVSER